MIYEEYKAHEAKALTQGDLQCPCATCVNYRWMFADQLEAERLAE